MNLRNNRKTVSLGVGKQLAVMQHFIILIENLILLQQEGMFFRNPQTLCFFRCGIADLHCFNRMSWDQSVVMEKLIGNAKDQAMCQDIYREIQVLCKNYNQDRLI